MHSYSYMTAADSGAADQPAPLYYLFYNLACTESLTGSNTINYIEAALVLGYPKSERQWFTQDPDLTLLRKTNGKELEDLLKRYE